MNGRTIASIKLEDQSETKKCDYELQIAGDEIFVGLKDGGNPKNTKGKLVITTNEYAEKTIVQNVTIATETKKPVLALNKKTETLYTEFYWNDEKPSARVKVVDKATQTALTAYELQVKEGKNWVNIEADSNHSYASNKNTYTIKHKDGILTLTLNTENKATDKFKFRVKQADWADNNYVELSYTIKVDTSTPKLVADNSTLTLNKNEDIYESQLAKTKLTLKGGDNSFDKNYYVSIEGADIKAQNIKNKYLNFSFIDGEIKVSFNDSGKDLTTGKYKYNVWLESDNTRSVYTTITVNIVDVALQKCVTVKGTGKIDILDRKGTSLTYTVKASNLQGRLVGASLAGQDAKKFYVSEAGDGKFVVKACENTAFSTKVTYKVVPVLVFANEEGWTYTIKTGVQKIKVKQGKPKVTITTADGVQNVLYRDRDNTLALDFNAVLGKKPVAIKGFKLVDYTSDLAATDIRLENGELKGVVLSQKAENQIIASGKKWNVKFNIYFVDGAGNEKVTQVTYKLIVK